MYVITPDTTYQQTYGPHPTIYTVCFCLISLEPYEYPTICTVCFRLICLEYNALKSKPISSAVTVRAKGIKYMPHYYTFIFLRCSQERYYYGWSRKIAPQILVKSANFSWFLNKKTNTIFGLATVVSPLILKHNEWWSVLRNKQYERRVRLGFTPIPPPHNSVHFEIEIESSPDSSDNYSTTKILRNNKPELSKSLSPRKNDSIFTSVYRRYRGEEHSKTSDKLEKNSWSRWAFSTARVPRFWRKPSHHYQVNVPRSGEMLCFFFARIPGTNTVGIQ